MAEFEQRFLVIRLGSIGDIVHTLPAVAALGEAFPGARIDWVVEAGHACLLEDNPFIHRLIRLETRAWRGGAGAVQAIEDIARGLMTLREASFDAALDFQGLYKSGLIAWLSRSRERVGFAENWLREPAVGVFYSQRVAPRGRRHVIEMNLALVEHLGAVAPEPAHWKFPLPSSESDERHIDRQLSSLGASKFIIVNPGGGWKSKCWEPDNYAEFIRLLDRDLACPILLTGSQPEEGLIQTILKRAASRLATYIPSTLAQFIALARRATVFVGGDTGPLHLAAAVGTPIVAIYSARGTLNTPERNGPFRPGDIVLVGGRPGDHVRVGKDATYLAGVPVESVLRAVRQRLASSS